MASTSRDMFIPVPSDRCMVKCERLFSSCYKLRGYSQPHFCLAWGANDEELFALLLTLIVFILILLIGGSLLYTCNRLVNKYKKKHTGEVELVAMTEL